MAWLKQDDKKFYRALLAITIPIALQNLIGAALNMVDTVMIGQLGETQIAAVGLANQITFLLHLFVFGISSGSAIFTAQFWGDKDLPSIKRVLGLALACGQVIAGVFLVASLLAPAFLLRLFTPDQAVISLGRDYLVIVALTFPLMAVSFTYSAILRSTGKARLPLYISALALVLNTVLNYILILGKLGLPALGVRGAAIATLVARLAEAILIVGLVYRQKLILAASFRELTDISLAFVRRFLHTTIPVVLNESLWAVGVTLYTVIYARMGTDVVAAINISSTAERLAMVLFFGIANATAVMLGNLIGAGQIDEAFHYAKKISLFGPLIGIFSGAFLILASPLILSFYAVSPPVLQAARGILLVFGVTMIVRVFNIINVVGILRSGGDTRFTLMLDAIGVWLIGVPLAFVGGLLFRLPIEQVMILIIVEEVFKSVFGLRRLHSRKWINRLTGKAQAQEPGLVPETGEN